jgi:hypothetical protein
LHYSERIFLSPSWNPPPKKKQRCYPRNLKDDTLQGRATKIFDEFPAGTNQGYIRKFFPDRKSFVVKSQLGAGKVTGTFLQCSLKAIVTPSIMRPLRYAR